MRYNIEKLIKRHIKQCRDKHANSGKSEIEIYVDMVVNEARDFYRYWIDDKDYMHVPDPCWENVETINTEIWNQVVKLILDDCMLYDRRKFFKLWGDRSILDFVLRDSGGNFISTING